MENLQCDRLHIFIDESSTLGFKLQEPFFSICALILKEQDKKPLKNSAKKILLKLNEGRRNKLIELHASEMSFKEKTTAYNWLSNKNFQISYLVAHKLSIHPNLFKKKNVCFNYFVFLSLRKVLEKTHLKEIHITIDTRSVKVTSEKSLEDYLNIQLVEMGIYDKNVHVAYGDSKNYKHLQITDIFSNAIYAKYNFGKDHFYSLVKSKVLHGEHFPQWFFDKNEI